MALRRPRMHSTGISNLDCRTQQEWKLRRASRSPLHTSKRQHFQECLGVVTPGRPDPDLNRTSAAITQENYYKSAGRRVARPVDRVSTAPIAGQNPFIGGDNDPFIKFPGKRALPMPSKATAFIQAMRSRYTQNTALHTVFTHWDSKGNGVVGAQDVIGMGKELGMEVGEKEAEAIVAAAGKRAAEGLNFTDFVELIRTEDRSLSPIKSQPTPERTQRLQDLLKTQVQAQLPLLTGKLARRATGHRGLIARQAFCEVLNDLSLPHAFSNPHTWLLLYTQAGGLDSGIDYRAFIKVIEAYSPPELPVNKEMEQTLDPAKGSKAEKSVVLDLLRVPVNRVESIFATSRRICRLLREKFPTQTALRAHIQSSCPANQLSQGYIKTLVEETAKELPGLKLRKEEMDSFLSRFVYNRQQETSITGLIQSIYQAEDLVEASLQGRIRAEPTLQPDPASKPDSEPDIRHVLQGLEQQLFIANGLNSFQAFKRLDADKDGFMTMEDLSNGLTALHVPHTTAEARALMGKLDADGKGFVDYQQFAKLLRPDMAQKSPLQTEQGNSAAQPSLSFLSTQLQQTKGLNESFARARSRNMDGEMRQSTRFASTPQQHNTFLHYHPDTSSPLYLSEKDRFLSKRIAPLSLAAEDYTAKQQLRTAKEQRYREAISSVNDSLTLATTKAAQLDACRLSQLAAFREDYERVRAIQRCHLQSAL